MAASPPIHGSMVPSLSLRSRSAISAASDGRHQRHLEVGRLLLHLVNKGAQLVVILLESSGVTDAVTPQGVRQLGAEVPVRSYPSWHGADGHRLGHRLGGDNEPSLFPQLVEPHICPFVHLRPDTLADDIMEAACFFPATDAEGF